MNTKKIRPSMGTDFTSGAILPMLIRFFLPFLAASLLNGLYTTVDSIVMGHFVGSQGIVAVTMGGKMLNLFTGMGMALAGGGQVLISQTVGAKKKEELNATIGTLFVEMLTASVTAAVILLCLSRNILAWMNTPEESFEAALGYLRITCAGLPLIFGYNAVCSVLRGMGDSKNPLLYILVATVFNIIGDIVFVARFQMGAVGTAIATVMGQGLALAFSVFTLYRKRERFGFDFRRSSFRVDREKLGIMLRLGLPMSLRSLCISLTQLILMGQVNLYGVTSAAAYSIADKLVHLTNIFHVATTQAAGSMIGQNFAANKSDRVRSVVRHSAGIALTAAVILSVCFVCFPKGIFGIFSDDPLVLGQAPTFMLISCVIVLLSAVMGAFEAVVVGTGNIALGFISGFLDGVVFRICFSFLFGHVVGMGAAGFFLGDALARLGPLLIGGFYYGSGAWTRHKKLVKNPDAEETEGIPTARKG